MCAVAFGLSLGNAAARADCASPSRGIGVARTIEIDAAAGPIFGSFTKQAREPSFLRPKEVVLTFDDGPMPWITKSILDTLDTYCTKATFFSVGKMALAYPGTVKDILARGHTLGSHTYSHPYNLGAMKSEKAQDEIERGLAAVATAAGVPVAPFFRFTGLSDSAALLGYLQTRHIAAFSVDAVSDDSYIHETQKLVDHTLKEIEAAKGGIVLFHDIKTTTAKALPAILSALKTRGYTIVHMRPKDVAVPLSSLLVELAPKLAKVEGKGEPKTLLPFYGATGPEKIETEGALEVTAITPEPRDRTIAKSEAKKPAAETKGGTHETKPPVASTLGTRTLGWTSSVMPNDEDDPNPPVFVIEETEPKSTSVWETQVKPTDRPKLRHSMR